MLHTYSPYNYAVNNPLLFIDPDGEFPYTFHIRAFAPPNAFKPTNFHDDQRLFSARTNSEVTSRIKQEFTVDPSARTLEGGKPLSDPTKTDGGLSMTAEDQGGVSMTSFGTMGGEGARVSLESEFQGKNPFGFGLAPAIDVGSAISIEEDLDKGQVSISLDLFSKQFPATEALVQDSNGNTVFLAGAAAFGGAQNLLLGKKKKAASVNLVININEEGIFQSVTFDGKNYSLKEFNKLGTYQNPGPFPRNDKDKENEQ